MPSLNRYQKQAIVRAILADTPKIDYAEKLQTLVLETRLKALPVLMQRVWDDASLRGFIKVSYCYTVQAFVPFADTPITDDNVMREIERLTAAHTAQKRSRDVLQRKLTAALEPIKTTKQLRDRLPEFSKYFDAEVGQAINSPAVANLLKDLVQAGWPKSTPASA